MDRSRFAVLKHIQPARQIPLYRRQHLAGEDALPAGSEDVHYDLMLDSTAGLLTWALPHCPSTGHRSMPAIQLPIHRRAYLQYEGLVSNDRGSVKRVMSGTWKLLEMTPPNTLDGRFAQIVFQLTPDNIVLPLQLTLKRLTQDKFQITSWHRLGSPG